MKHHIFSYILCITTIALCLIEVQNPFILILCWSSIGVNIFLLVLALAVYLWTKSEAFKQRRIQEEERKLLNEKMKKQFEELMENLLKKDE